jgi:hypothetical protein
MASSAPSIPVLAPPNTIGPISNPAATAGRMRTGIAGLLE